MGWIKLRRLVICNFRSFRGRHELTFPESGLVIIKGNSGFGKTNVLLALSYGFRYCPHSAKDLQCWQTEDPMSVEIHMDTGEGPAVLTRGDKLSLTVAGNTIQGSAKAVEAHLDRLCGIGPSLREALTYRDQRDPKKILSMDDKELKKFLTQVLGLEGLETEVADATKRLTPLERELDAAKTMEKALQIERDARYEEAKPPVLVCLKYLEKAVEDAGNRAEASRMALDANDAELLEAVDEEQEQSDLVKKAYKEQIAKLKAEPIDMTERDHLVSLRSECQEHLRRLMLEDAKTQNAYEAETQALTIKLRHLHDEMAHIPTICSAIERLKAEADKLKDSVCPTCERTWSSAQEEYGRRQLEIQEQEAVLETIRAHQALVEELEKQIKSRKFLEDSKIARLRDVDIGLKEQIAVEEQKTQNANAIVQAQVSDLQAASVKAELAIIQDPGRRVATLTNANRELRDVFAEYKGILTKAEQQLALAVQGQALASQAHLTAMKYFQDAERRHLATASKAAEAEKELHRESDYLDLLRGFRNKIFDEVLESISVEANNVIASLPNAQHIAIEFRSERETGSGAIEQRIKPVITIHGEEHGLAASVSGGQFTGIELAVDLAVAKVVSARLGCNLRWMLLDEAFDGFDQITQESCLELMKTYASDKLVLLVSHASEMSELVNNKIVVTHENGLSKIETDYA